MPTDTAATETRLVTRGPSGCNQVALTYDAGSGAEGAAAILDALARHNVRATFFLTGRWVERFPDLARRIASAGHEIGSHSHTHPDLTRLSQKRSGPSWIWLSKPS
ncbi:MAG: polysaccharide deacetylase family protein [Armatimonadota bacterium]|nr:polysaccharide deacetylase family protein [Armatimonadota bacterium]